jgi:predicted GIY-YIG superfamily endonuclease
MSACFYILRLKSGALYPGATTDLDRRWKEHVSGDACQTTQRDPPESIVYHEAFATFPDARRREAQIKRWTRKKKEALVAGDKALLRALAVSHDHEPETTQDRETTQP